MLIIVMDKWLSIFTLCVIGIVLVVTVSLTVLLLLLLLVSCTIFAISRLVL